LGSSGTCSGSADLRAIRVPRGVLESFWGSRLAPHRAEAVGAVDGLAARRAERDACLVAAVRAGGAEHLARATVVAARAVAATAAVATTTAAAAVAAGIAVARRVAGAAGLAGGLAGGSVSRATSRLGEA